MQESLTLPPKCSLQKLKISLKKLKVVLKKGDKVSRPPFKYFRLIERSFQPKVVPLGSHPLDLILLLFIGLGNPLPSQP